MISFVSSSTGSVSYNSDIWHCSDDAYLKYNISLKVSPFSWCSMFQSLRRHFAVPSRISGTSYRFSHFANIYSRKSFLNRKSYCRKMILQYRNYAHLYLGIFSWFTAKMFQSCNTTDDASALFDSQWYNEDCRQSA